MWRNNKKYVTAYNFFISAFSSSALASNPFFISIYLSILNLHHPHIFYNFCLLLVRTNEILYASSFLCSHSAPIFAYYISFLTKILYSIFLKTGLFFLAHLLWQIGSSSFRQQAYIKILENWL